MIARVGQQKRAVAGGADGAVGRGAGVVVGAPVVGGAGRVVLAAKWMFRKTCQVFINEAFAKARYGNADKMNFEAPLTSLVWLTSIVSVALTYIVSYWLIADMGDGSRWWKLSTVITCGTLAGAIIPELVKVFTSTESRHVREVVTASREGGASLNILSGFVAGNFSAFWTGLCILALMAGAYYFSNHAAVQANRLNEMVWSMDVQINKLTEGHKHVQKADDTVARMEKLAQETEAQLGARQALRGLRLGGRGVHGALMREEAS